MSLHCLCPSTKIQIKSFSAVATLNKGTTLNFQDGHWHREFQQQNVWHMTWHTKSKNIYNVLLIFLE